MCLKRLSNGLRIGVIVGLLLLLSLPLAAWPSWLGGSEDLERISHLQNSITALEGEIQSQRVLIEQKETLLNELQAELQNSRGANKELESTVLQQKEQLQSYRAELINYENLANEMKNELTQLETELNELVHSSQDSGDVDAILKERILQLEAQLSSLTNKLSESELTINSLKSDLDSALTLSGLSSEEYQSLLNDYLPLKAAYEELYATSQEYYETIVTMEKPGVAGFLGSSGMYNPATGDFGAELTVGIGFGDIMLTGGAMYWLDTPLTFDINKMQYKAGIQYRF